MHGGEFYVSDLTPGKVVIDKGLSGFGNSKLTFVEQTSEIDPIFRKYVFKYKFNDEKGNPVILTNYQAASRLTPATSGGKLRSRQQKRGRTQRGRTQRGRTQRRRSPRQQKRGSPRQQKRGRTQRGRRSPRE